MHRRSIIALLTTLALVAGLALAPPTSAQAGWSGQVEAESQLAGQLRSDGQASGGQYVRLTAAAASDPTQPGAGRLSLRTRGGGVMVTQGSDLLAIVDGSGGWTTETIPLWLDAQPVVIHPVGSADVDWLELAPGAVGYTTRGETILSPDGDAWTPRGVNRHSLEWTPSGWYLTEGELDHMVRWGVDTMRLPVSQDFWLPGGCNYNPWYAIGVQWYVERATARGLYVLLDLHTRSNDGCGTQYLARMANEASVDFWTSAATMFGDNPLVGFDLWNEPHDIAHEVWRDGGSVGGEQLVGMQTLYDTVRATGAENLVFVSGNNWAAVTDVMLTHALDAWGVVSAVHVYNDGKTSLSPTLDQRTETASYFFPMVATEFGTNLNSRRYLDNAIDWAETRDHGWIAYTWFAGSGPWNLLDSWTTYEPNRRGGAVWDGLAVNR